MAQAPLITRPAHSDIRIVILGKTGTGKSATGNSILGSPEFECSPGGDISTSRCLKKKATRFEKNILVIDTPGLQDNKTPRHETRSEIQKSIEMAYPVCRVGNSGPNVFLLCLRMGRFTVEDETMFKDCLVCFGEEMYRFTIVVFTHVDVCGADINEDDYTDSIPEFAKTFIGKCRSIIFFDNTKTGPEMELQVKSLFKKIDAMMGLNGGKIYTGEILKQVVYREKMQNYMNFINGPYAINSMLAIGNLALFFLF